ncbi:MAG: alpha/beta hydrolase family protein [Mesorhizobium sp.]
MTPEALRHLVRVPDRPRVAPTVLSRDIAISDGVAVETMLLDLGEGRRTRAFLTRPEAREGRLPAVLYCHAHGARYGIGAAELLDGRPSLLGPWGPMLARRGFVTLCLDMPTFGDSADQREDSLSKALLWQGRTLMGEMLADLLAGFDHLAARDDVDPARVAAFGLSMGATHGYFLAAIEPRIARVAHLCCFADLATLIRTGAHDLHGHYMTIPGLLSQASFGRIAGMVAPRPQLICTGDRDPLTPPDAVAAAFAECRAAYRAAGAEAALSWLAEPDTGHVETPAMREAVLAFLDAMR